MSEQSGKGTEHVSPMDWDPISTDTADQGPSPLSISDEGYQLYKIESHKPYEISECEYDPGRLPRIILGDVIRPDSQNSNMDKYKVLKYLGRGGFAKVWLSETKIGEYSAIKVTESDKYFREAAEREIMFMGILQKFRQHNNIVKFLGCFAIKNDTVQHMALRFEALGPNLDHILDRSVQKFHPNVMKTIIKQLLEALKYIHRKFIIHVDIKPSNILIAISKENMLDIVHSLGSTDDYYLDLNYSKLNVKLGDFGVSVKTRKACQSEHLSTCAYRAPESFLTTTIDFPIDLWSMGCVIHKIVTRKPLFTCGQEKDDEQHGIAHLIKMARTLGPIPAAPFRTSSRPVYEEVFGKRNSFSRGNPFVRGNFVEAAAGYLEAQEANRFYNFMQKFLEYDPKKRITAAMANEDEFLHPQKRRFIIRRYIIKKRQVNPDTKPEVASQMSAGDNDI
uniref:Protein kinase domain-containing protein n=1 Tax=Caenorhabditis tropicalis TaxID=1561998 RepID=A0A1I7U1W0_9PELO